MKGFILPKYSLLLAVLLSGAAFGVQAAEDDSGWLESYNRSMFNFNYQLDKYTLKPLAEGYRAITTPDVRNRVTSFIGNMREPVTAVNHTLQGSIKDTFVSVGRFLINSTLGELSTLPKAGDSNAIPPTLTPRWPHTAFPTARSSSCPCWDRPRRVRSSA